jgi:hypothetical protein
VTILAQSRRRASSESDEKLCSTQRRRYARHMQAPALSPLVGIISATVRPVGPALERAVGPALTGPQIRAAVSNALSRQAVCDVIDDVFASEAFDALLDGLLASEALWELIDGLLDRIPQSPALWRLVDELMASPSVTAAVAQQSLGFADQLGDEVRARSAKADELLERIVQRLAGRAP